MEYAFHVDQGRSAAPGTPDFTSVDIVQAAPFSEIGIKGEEKLGGGFSAWFQCASTADIRGFGLYSRVCILSVYIQYLSIFSTPRRCKDAILDWSGKLVDKPVGPINQ